MQQSGAQILINVLLEQGVDRIFGYPGGAVLPIYDALYDCRDRIAHYMTAHEQGAAHAADGYARLTGRTGVVLATSGPGATNLVTGIAAAYMDSVPMVAITGNVATNLIGRDSFQEVYIAGITMPITKHNFIVRHTSALADTVRQAFRIAQSGRKGPVLVDIPKDVALCLSEYSPMPAVVPDRPPLPRQKDIARAAELLNASERPVVCFGGGVSASEAGEKLRALLEKADIPATHTLMGAGVLGYGDPHNLGLLGMHGSRTANLAVDHADVVLAIGTRFSDRVAFNAEKFAGQAQIIHVDIDPSEINKNVRAAHSIVGDVHDVLSRLTPMVEKRERKFWMQRIRKWRQEDYVPPNSGDALKPYGIIQTIYEAVGENAVFVTDVGQHQMWAAQYLRHVRPRSFLTSGGLGAMGYGYGAAIGACLAANGRPVVHITGDGSFHMNMNEACTAVTYGVPVITVILNNNALGMVRQQQEVFCHGRFSCSEPERRTDYVKVAEGFGAKGARCTNLPELREAIQDALHCGGPVWIECPIDREERVIPMIPAGGTVDDILME